MTWRSRPEAWAPLLVLLLAFPARAAAQGWREVQLWGTALASKPAVFAGGFGLARRDQGRTRIGIALAGGATDDGRAAGRAELAYHFLLDPARRTGWSVYGGGGLALGIVERGNLVPYVQAVIGIESSPAGRSGFFLESGFGGGVRAAAGVRWRTPRHH